jgi:hypothetical protein
VVENLCKSLPAHKATMLNFHFYLTDHESRKISSAEDPVVSGEVNQDAFHQVPSLKPMSYPSFSPPLPPGLDSDSGYGSTPSSVQRIADEDDRLHWSSPGKRWSPYQSSLLNLAPKRVRIEGKAGEPITRTRSALDDRLKENYIRKPSEILPCAV